MDAWVSEADPRPDEASMKSLDSLSARLGHVGQQVPPLSIADVWLFPPLPEIQHSAEFVLFTRMLEDGCRALYSARLVPANGKPAHQIVLEHGRAPADRVIKLVTGLQRRLGQPAPVKHVSIGGDQDRWQALIDGTREAETDV